MEGWPLAPNRWVGVFLPRPAPLPRRLFNSLSCLLCNCSGLPRRRWIPQAGSHHGHHLAETTPVDHTCSASAAGPLQGLVSFTPALGDLRACFTTIALATHTQVSSPCLPPSSPTTHLSCYSHLGFWHAHHPEPVLGHGLDLGCPNWEELLLLLLWLPWHGNESTQIPPASNLWMLSRCRGAAPRVPPHHGATFGHPRWGGRTPSVPHGAWYSHCLAAATTRCVLVAGVSPGGFSSRTGIVHLQGLGSPQNLGLPHCHVPDGLCCAHAGRAGVRVCAGADGGTHRIIAWVGLEGTCEDLLVQPQPALSPC